VTDDIGSVSTDESGHYEMSLPELGRYRARIDGGGRILERVSFTVLNSGEQRQDFHLAGGSISGSVRDRDGEPVSAEVTALPVEQSLLEGSHRTRSSSDGRFELLALTPGSYRIAAQVQGQDSVEIGPIELRDQPLDGIELVLGDDKPLLRGRVVDPYGLAAANAFVLAIPSGQPNSALYANVASDLRGEFELRSPVNGAVDLIAFTTGFAPAVRRGWVARHDDPERLLMQLTEGATLNVRLLNATGCLIVGRFVSIEGLPPTTITATQSALATTMPSGPDGISRLRGLLPGRYRLRGPGIATADVDIGSGGESSIDLREPSSALSPAQ
jgi:hypothetical protein